MPEHRNVSLHRRGHDAFRNGDVETLAELFAEDTVWHWPGKSSLGGDFRGRAAVLELLAKLGEMVDSLEFVDEDFLASETRTVSLSHLKATRDGKTLEYDLCEVVRWQDGKVAEEWVLVDDQYAYDEFWGASA